MEIKSLAQAIRTFHSNGASRETLLAVVDTALASDNTSVAELLSMLGEEQARTPLPPDVYAAVLRRIEHASLASHGDTADETRLQTSPGILNVPPSPRPSPPLASSGSSDVPASGIDGMKEVGDTLNGRFVLEECLGIGGMGTVYKALDLRKLEASDRRPYIAIKVLNLQFRGNPKSLIALQREAKKAQTLGHRNIVTVYDFDRDGPVVYLTMEYLSGRPLSRLLREPTFKGMSYDDALPVVTGMANALAYAHERGFVHCDFKPGNVFLTDTHEIKVIDFGIARVFQRPEEEVDATVFDPGSLGAMTPAYASPEMLEHREPDPRDDIYALACTTYELLTGRHPYDRVPANQARSANLKPPRPDGLGARQWRALRMGLSLERETRTASVTQFLHDFGSGQKLKSRPKPGPEQKRTSPARPGVLKAGVVAGALAVIVGGGIAWYAARTPQPQSPARSQQQARSQPPESREVTAPTPPLAPAPKPLSMETLAPAISAIPCSALAASLSGTVVTVNGFVGRSVGLGKVQSALAQVSGVSNPTLQVREVDDDKCDVLKLAAPYWNAHPGATIHTKNRSTDLLEGQSLAVSIGTPAYDSWVNIDYYQLDGSVVHMLPNPRSKDNQAPPNYAATIGSAGDWIVGKPFGAEMIMLIAAPAPLFDKLRPESEPRADYLRAASARLQELARKYGRDKVAVDIVQIDTHARKH